MPNADLVRWKNEAFDRLARAELEIWKRIHAQQAGKRGPVPAAWWERCEELAEKYERAKIAAKEG